MRFVHFPDDTTVFASDSKGKGKVFYGQEPPSGESSTTECGFKLSTT